MKKEKTNMHFVFVYLTESLAFHGANRDVTPDKINFELDPDEQLEKESGEAEKEPEA